ncbi:MAG: phosphoribosyltransferase [bacterium]
MNLLQQLYGVFLNREEAGKLLSARLECLKDSNPVILGLPRGGVIIAHQIAKRLKAELDVVVVRKLRAPESPELAIGAVTETGATQLNQDVIQALQVSEKYLRLEEEAQRRQLRARADTYRKVRERVPLTGRVVVLTDDGVATGATMKAAIYGVRAENPGRLILAIPVGELSTLEELRNQVDQMLVLERPSFFGGVGLFYQDFSQVDEDRVINILKKYA